jgi:hypothetical protein
VKDALKAKVGKGKLSKIESLTKHDKLVAYEAQVVTDGKRSEAQVGRNGEPLDHEEWRINQPVVNKWLAGFLIGLAIAIMVSCVIHIPR